MNDRENEAAQLQHLGKLGFSSAEIATVVKHHGWTPGKIIKELNKLFNAGLASERYAVENFREAFPELFGEDAETEVKPRKAKKASEFGEATKRFLWYPYLPIGEYTVMMADGGTGKGVLCCGIAAAVSAGRMLPGDAKPRKPGTVLIISAEDDGADFKDRLRKSGADLERCQIIDRSDSVGMSIADQYEEFAATVDLYKPALVVLDPWHGFLGADVDISRVNAIRPILQKLALLAKSYDTAIIAVSHVNKRTQGENANNAATGSTDFINAARSAVKVIFDESDPELSRRIIVHTKSNFAVYGKSVIYRINDGGLEWAGFSEITKLTLEAAARNRKSVGEQIAEVHKKEETNERLIAALMEAARGTELCGARISYNEFKLRFGDDIFGDMQPKRALDALIPAMESRGITLETGKQIRRDNKLMNGFFLQEEGE